MAYELNPQYMSLMAAADLSAKQYYLIDIDTNGKAALAGNGEQIAGSLQNKPTAGQTAKVQISGVAKVLVAEAITQGSNVASDADGKGVNAATGDAIFGVAVTSATAAGDIIPVLITQAGESA